MNHDDEEALERFCMEAYPSLVGALAHHTGDWHLAEECAQEALVRVCDRWSKVRHMESPTGWAFRVGVNLANSHFRRRGAERRAHQRHGPTMDTVDVTDTSDQLTVQAALDELTDQQREAVVLRYFLGLDTEQTARTMRTTIGAVRSLTHRAILALRDILDLEDELKEPSDAS